MAYITDKRGKKTIIYKEEVADELQLIGVPKLIAELSVIDLRSQITTGFYNNKTPKQTASSLIDTITKLYKENDKWHYDKYL